MRNQLFILLCLIAISGFAWQGVYNFHSYKEYVIAHENDTFATAGYDFNQSNVEYLENPHKYARHLQITEIIAFASTALMLVILWFEIADKLARRRFAKQGKQAKGI
jgi:hypothetical protein